MVAEPKALSLYARARMQNTFVCARLGLAAHALSNDNFHAALDQYDTAMETLMRLRAEVEAAHKASRLPSIEEMHQTGQLLTLNEDPRDNG